MYDFWDRQYVLNLRTVATRIELYKIKYLKLSKILLTLTHLANIMDFDPMNFNVMHWFHLQIRAVKSYIYSGL